MHSQRRRWEREKRSTHHFEGSVGCNEVPTHPTKLRSGTLKTFLNQMLKYLCITMSAGAWEPETITTGIVF